MYRIPTPQLQAGMIVARAVTTATGAVLLRPGTEIQAVYVAQLQRLGVPAVYIQNAMAPDLDIPDPVAPELRHEAAGRLKQALDGFAGMMGSAVGNVVGNASRKFSVNVGALKESVASIVDQVKSNPQVMIHLTDIRTADEWTLQHSVSVSVSSVLVGRQLGLTPSQLNDLAMGALLHDVGKQGLSPAVLRPTGPLTPQQQEEYKKHTTLGFEILRKQADISLIVAAIAFQHHERWGGDGFPRGIKGTDIHELARIVAVVNQFDNLVTDRVERPGIATERALLVMEALAKEHFEPRVVQALVQCVAKYPVGSAVSLSDGSMGIVTAVDKQFMELPRVRVVRGPGGAAVSPFEVDLVNSRLTITGTVKLGA